MQEKLRDPRVVGFIIGFSIVALVGLVAIASLAILAAPPSPTLVPTSASIAERTTIVPTAREGQIDTPAPASEDRPASSPTPEPAGPSITPTRSEPLEHTVREGDTLFTIALAYGVNVETLREANDLSEDTILLCQVLVVPPEPLPTPTPFVERGVIVHNVSSG